MVLRRPILAGRLPLRRQAHIGEVVQQLEFFAAGHLRELLNQFARLRAMPLSFLVGHALGRLWLGESVGEDLDLLQHDVWLRCGLLSD